ncbi:Uncharacterised protein [Neisseria gonorrhoeae]|uniref:Uncharacterized protein n=1 Tax=Neisseria gonorrhoeae TaxID=485 RepID=A0A378VTD4_NEIGO|nr:Uncharacterised protein [Neisseria gonorrhoeae]
MLMAKILALRGTAPFVPSYEPSGRNSGAGAASGESAGMPLPSRRRRVVRTAWSATAAKNADDPQQQGDAAAGN